MTERPSESLLRLLRDAAQQKGLNTASLARAVGRTRAELKHVLSGQQDLTVDLLVQLTEALDLGPEEMTALGLDPLSVEAPTLSTIDNSPGFQAPTLDPYGNHAEQILKMGFALGCDLHMVLDTARLAGSGIPDSVLEEFEDRLPLRLDAAFHKQNDPCFLPDGIQLVLSFDALYTCTLAWSSLLQITLFPLPCDPQLDGDEEPTADAGSHLRLVE